MYDSIQQQDMAEKTIQSAVGYIINKFTREHMNIFVKKELLDDLSQLDFSVKKGEFWRDLPFRFNEQVNTVQEWLERGVEQERRLFGLVKINAYLTPKEQELVKNYMQEAVTHISLREANVNGFVNQQVNEPLTAKLQDPSRRDETMNELFKTLMNHLEKQVEERMKFVYSLAMNPTIAMFENSTPTQKELFGAILEQSKQEISPNHPTHSPQLQSSLQLLTTKHPKLMEQLQKRFIQGVDEHIKQVTNKAVKTLHEVALSKLPNAPKKEGNAREGVLQLSMYGNN